MPTLQQTAVALSGAVNFLENKDTKNAHSTRASVSMTELGNSAGGVFNHLTEAETRERQAVADDVGRTAGLLKQAEANVKEAKAGVKGADGKKAKASAEMELAKEQARLTVAKATAEAAAAHATAAAPVNELEDKATQLQANAEDARDAADTLKAEGDEHVAAAQDKADADIEEAEATYDAAMTVIENEVKSALGV